MRVLVTGGAGFIGSNLALELEKAGHDVIVLDDLSTGTYANLEGFSGDFVTADLKSLTNETLKTIDAEAVFHQGAITDTTVYDETLMLKTNLDPLRVLLKHCAEKEAPLIYASSAAVYGSSPPPQKEENAGKPLNVYGFSKWMCDCAVMRHLKANKDAKVIGLRYFNVFGSGEQNKGKMSSMVFQLYSQIKAGKKPRLYKWGEQKRDFVYVKDVISANILALEKGESGIYNIGSGKSRSFNDVCNALFDALGLKGNIEYFDNPYSDKYQDLTEASVARSREGLGFEPKWSLEQSVTDYVKRLDGTLVKSDDS